MMKTDHTLKESEVGRRYIKKKRIQVLGVDVTFDVLKTPWEKGKGVGAS